MNKSTKSGFKITAVTRVLRLKDVESYRAIVYKVTGPNGLVKFFNFKKNAIDWVTNYTTRHPLTLNQKLMILAGK
jgi:hypothetical protein